MLVQCAPPLCSPLDLLERKQHSCDLGMHDGMHDRCAQMHGLTIFHNRYHLMVVEPKDCWGQFLLLATLRQKGRVGGTPITVALILCSGATVYSSRWWSVGCCPTSRWRGLWTIQSVLHAEAGSLTHLTLSLARVTFGAPPCALRQALDGCHLNQACVVLHSLEHLRAWS